MTDIDLVKRNIGKIIDQGAPETDIDAYLGGEGVSIDEFQLARQNGVKEVWSSHGRLLSDGLVKRRLLQETGRSSLLGHARSVLG